MRKTYSIVIYDGMDGASVLLREDFPTFASCENRYFDLCEIVQCRQVDDGGEEIDNPLFGGFVRIEH